MSQCIVPNWYLKEQIQEAQRAQGGGDRCPESDVQGNKNNNPSSIISPTSSKYGVAELKWENGQLGMYGLGLALGGLNIPSTATTTTKPAWKWNDTLESIVHQATSHNHMNSNDKPISLNNYLLQNNQYPWQPKSASMAASSVLLKKRMPEDDSDYKCTQEEEEEEDRIGDMYASTATASVSAAFWRDNSNNDTTNMMTCPSYDSPATTFNTKTTQEDSAFHAHAGSENQGDQEHDQGTKSEKKRFLSSRRSRAAAIHNQSERRRRDRINQKIKALQRLVPNASKTDKASMLEEVIDYIKQLQLQVQLMSSVRNMPQMMVPLGLQQQHRHHLQMSLLAARMGMGVGLGMGIGMFDMNTMATAATARSAPHQSLIHATAPVSATTPTFIPNSPFIVPPMNMITQLKPDQPATAHTNASSVTLTADPYHAFLSQVSSMNVELYNKMSALYRQQLYQMTQHQATSSSPSTQSQGD